MVPSCSSPLLKVADLMATAFDLAFEMSIVSSVVPVRGIVSILVYGRE